MRLNRFARLVAALSALWPLTLPATGAAGPAATPEGYWRTPEDNGVVKVEVCGEGLCGVVVTSDVLKAHPDQTDALNRDPAKRSRGLKGLSIFAGMKGGPTEWKGGSVYNPDDGRTYHGAIRLTKTDTLELTGCIMAPLCRTETWTRIAHP